MADDPLRIPRDAPLAMDAETFRTLGHRLVDQLAEFLESLPQRAVTHDASPSAVRNALDLTGPLPESGMDAGLLLERTAQLLFDHSLFNGHPRFFGYITAAPAPIGILGERQRWRVGAVAGRHGDRVTNRAMDCVADRVPNQLRRVARERRQHGELGVFFRRSRRESALERSRTRGHRQR